MPATTEPKRRRFSKNFVFGGDLGAGLRQKSEECVRVHVCDCVYVCPLLPLLLPSSPYIK